MTVNVLLLVLALVTLALSADRFVLGAARTAELMRVPPVVIGVVVIGFGTGLPELMTAVVASTHNNVALGISSVMGSMVVNSTLVLGTLGILSAPRIASSILKREGVMQLAAIVLFAVVVVIAHNRLSYAVLVIALVAFVAIVLKGSKGNSSNLEFEQDSEKIESSHSWGLPKAVLVMLAGLIFVLGSAELLINSASSIAQSLGLSKAIIGVTLVALGTSLPELVTAIAAARRGHSDLVIGNVFGANLFNATGVTGIAGLIAPGKLAIAHLESEAIFMVGASLIAWLFLSSSRRLTKYEGILLLGIYGLWIYFVSR